MTETYCKCGGWNNWTDAYDPDWHEATCPYPLDVDADESTTEYRDWYKHFTPPVEVPPLDIIERESYVEWYDRWVICGRPQGGLTDE